MLALFCEDFSLLHAREAEPGVALEYAFQIRMLDAGHVPDLVAEIERIDDVSHISLLMKDEEAMP